MSDINHKVKPYIPTGYYTIDLVGACINHAERYFRHVEEIMLAPKEWVKFIDSVKRLDESYPIENDRVLWDDNHGGEILIKKGHAFMVKPLEYKLKAIAHE